MFLSGEVTTYMYMFQLYKNIQTDFLGQIFLELFQSLLLGHPLGIQLTDNLASRTLLALNGVFKYNFEHFYVQTDLQTYSGVFSSSVLKHCEAKVHPIDFGRVSSQ